MDLGMEQLNSVDRVKALEGIMAFQAMSGHLRDFLEDFRKTDKVVTEADIKRFFAVSRNSSIIAANLIVYFRKNATRCLIEQNKPSVRSRKTEKSIYQGRCTYRGYH